MKNTYNNAEVNRLAVEYMLRNKWHKIWKCMPYIISICAIIIGVFAIVRYSIVADKAEDVFRVLSLVISISICLVIIVAIIWGIIDDIRNAFKVAKKEAEEKINSDKTCDYNKDDNIND